MSVDPTKEILSNEQIGAMVDGLIHTLLDGIFDQLGIPLQVVGSIFKDLKNENILAMCEELNVRMTEWKKTAELLDEEVKVES